MVAISDNGVIGRAGDLPWHLSADLVRFKKLTMGHTIIMGRKTYESIGRPLPGRNCVVLTRQQGYRQDGITVVSNLEEALALSHTDEELFVIGGAEIYRQVLPIADRLYVTRVHAEVVGDTLFPHFDDGDWKLTEESRHEADEKNAHPYTFQIYQRQTSRGNISP